VQADSAIWQEFLEVAKSNETAPFFLLGFIRSSLSEEVIGAAIRDYRAYYADLADQAADREALAAAAREAAQKLE
jgi:hypothetical protein